MPAVASTSTSTTDPGAFDIDSNAQGGADNGDDSSSSQQEHQPKTIVLSGILFSRSVRNSFASFTISPIPTSCSSSQQQQQQHPVLVRLQFMENVLDLRSYCRKQYKIGDKIAFLHTNIGRWEQPPLPSSSLLAATKTKTEAKQDVVEKISEDTGHDGKRTIDCKERDKDEGTSDTQKQQQQSSRSWSQKPRWVVDLSSASEAQRFVRVQASRFWSMKECQEYQARYISKPQQQKQKRKQEDEPHNKNKKPKQVNRGDTNSNNHGAGMPKLLQAQKLVDFFVRLIGCKVVTEAHDKDTPGDAAAVAAAAAIPTTGLSFEERNKLDEMVRDWCNRGDGVLDVAGGCGHVSMSFGMQGISSTVVDARASVGKLPRKDRKIWKRSLQNKPPRVRKKANTPDGPSPPAGKDQQAMISEPESSSQEQQQSQNSNKPHSIPGYEYCQLVVPVPTVVPFKSQQAWFGSKPIGYDASFRHPDEENIPVLVATAAAPKNDIENNNDEGVNNQSLEQTHSSGCFPVARNTRDDCSTTKDTEQQTISDNALRRQASALVALHPDEATGEIVQQAVKHRIPFVVVPCCVFSRLFPGRKTRDGKPVNDYEDLLDFLQEQDPSIQRTKLAFGGKNIALWSVFPDG